MNEYDILISFSEKKYRSVVEGADLVDAIMRFFLSNGYARLRKENGDLLSIKIWDAYGCD